MKKFGATVSISKEELLTQYPGMEFRVFEDAMTMCTKMMARPLVASVNTRRNYSILQVEKIKVPWANHWWMRFLRWLGTKLKSEVLNWVSEAATYRAWSSIGEMPEDVYERIVIQLNKLRACGEEPQMVLLGGGETLYRFQSDFERFMIFNPATQTNCIFGLEIKVSPWLAEDEVLVV